MNTLQSNLKTDFSLVYEFDAPKKMVFEAFATAEALNEWWGPVEAHNTVISLDFRPGGIFHFKMDFSGNISYGRFVFGKINRYDLLEFTNSFADENANVADAPFDFDFPRETFYRLHFIERNGKTILSMTGQPVKASDVQMNGFNSINSDMQRGWGATFDNLMKYHSI